MNRNFEELCCVNPSGSTARVEWRHVDRRGLVLITPFLGVKIDDSDWFPLDDINIAAEQLRNK